MNEMIPPTSPRRAAPAELGFCTTPPKAARTWAPVKRPGTLGKIEATPYPKKPRMQSQRTTHWAAWLGLCLDCKTFSRKRRIRS